jgi:CubicO group peptidase (beta-lactamase class C family)
MKRGCRSIIWMAAAACLVSVLAPTGLAQDPAVPGNPPLAHLKAYVEAFNAGVPGQMKAFFEAHFAASALKEVPLPQRLARFRGAKAQLKSLQIERIVSDEPLRASLLTKSAAGEFLLLSGTVEKTPPHNLLTLMIEMVEDPDEIIAPDPKAGDKEFAAAVKAFLDERTRADEFSGVVLVAKDSRALFHEAYGLADREAKVANRKDTKFNLGSINKNFTRVAIHQLVRQGKLSLDDTIKKILPDYPNAQAAEKVTVRHLLNMTSGIGDFFGERYDATPKEKILSLRDYLPLFVDQPLEFEPGTSNRYSNGGYIVLGLIIEKLSGTDYYTYVRENIFKPCGMTDTDAFPRDAKTPNLARGYARESDAAGSPRVLNFATLPGRGSSAGGGYSTAADMLKYIQALKDKKIFLPDVANGLGIAGGAPGINSVVEWDPRSGYVVIVLTNFDPPTAGRTARQIAAWLPR